MGSPWPNAVKRLSGFVYSTVADLWQPGFEGVPDPIIPSIAMGAPGWVFTNAYKPNPIEHKTAAVVRSASTNAGTTSIVVTLPTGVVANDLLLAVLAGGAGVTPNLPSGWTNFATYANAFRNLRVCYKIAGASETDPTFDVSSGVISGHIARIDGYDTSQPLEAAYATASATSTLRDFPVFDVEKSTPLFINFSDSGQTYTVPGDWAYIANSGDTFFGMFQRTYPVVGLGGAIQTVQGGSGAWAGVTVAVRPGRPAIATAELALPPINYMQVRFQHLMVR